jgi:GNAT superfamily N-acetyltransferase
MGDRNTLDFTFRKATTADALCIAVLGMQVFLDTYATDGIRDALAHEVLESFSAPAISALIAGPDTTFLVAEANGHLVGFAHLTTHTGHPMIGDPRAAELKRLYVQERFTGFGIGWQLLGRAEAEAASQGASMLWATVWVGNERALQFYPRQGYSLVGSPMYEFQGEAHENRLYRKVLSNG